MSKLRLIGIPLLVCLLSGLVNNSSLYASAAVGGVVIRVLSNRADLISGGDALIEVVPPPRASKAPVTMKLNGRDTTKSFSRRANGHYIGLVKDLALGRNALAARSPDGRDTQVIITNHPNGGPVFSGPQIQPWVCQKSAKDNQCNQPAAYSYLYMSSNPLRTEFQPYDPQSPPSDVAMTKTDQGVTVPFIVRIETGYQDRDQYRIATLFQPGKPWMPWSPQKQWNHKLLITHGGGCGASYGAGEAPTVLDNGNLPVVGGVASLRIGTSPTVALGRGFAVMSTALDNTGHNCNIAVGAESLVMAKEHLIETYGLLRYTIGTGCSGGSVTQHQVANAYPGVYQGLLVTCSYPDVLTPGAQFADYHLLRLYFEDPSRWEPGVTWTPSQMSAVEGHVSHLNAIAADEGLFKSATYPTYACNGTTDKQRYDPQTNPGGVRCSILDYMINVLGPRPKRAWSLIERKLGRGFAGAPFGNAGIQYGLHAWQRGQITTAQFVDLNARIGGLDIDVNPTAERVPGDHGALRNAYRSGAINETNNLDQVAIINHGGPDPGVAHDYAHAWWTRARIEREQGHIRNHVMWFGHEPLIGDTRWFTEALLAMDRWLTAVEKDHSDKSLPRRIVDDKPEDIQDRCSQIPGVELVTVPGAGRVCELDLVQTKFGTPRMVAGDGIESDTNNCSMRPLRRTDYYPLQLADDEWAQLRRTFLSGVCDWSKPGVGQRDTIPWLTYQQPDGNVVNGGRPLGSAPRGSGGGWTSPAFGSWREVSR